MKQLWNLCVMGMVAAFLMGTALACKSTADGMHEDAKDLGRKVEDATD